MTWAKIWSVLHGDMQLGTCPGAALRAVPNTKVDFPDLRVVLNLGGGGSEIVSKQVPGRASRKVDGKDAAYIIEFRHHWDTVKSPKTNREVAGPVFKDDIARMRIYEELGFEQIFIGERGFPWMRSSSSPTP